MRQKDGFTLIEISFALMILGIISAIVIVRLNTLSSYHKAEKSAWVLFKDLSSLRTAAMKNDCTVRVNFSKTGYTILEDLNNNGIADAREISTTKALPQFIAFGLPSKQPPSKAPMAITLPNGINFLSGSWKTQGLIIDSTGIARVNTGGLFINSPSLKKTTFCVAVTDSAQVFQFYKWDGSSWIDLR